MIIKFSNSEKIIILVVRRRRRSIDRLIGWFQVRAQIKIENVFERFLFYFFSSAFFILWEVKKNFLFIINDQNFFYLIWSIILFILFRFQTLILCLFAIFVETFLLLLFLLLLFVIRNDDERGTNKQTNKKKMYFLISNEFIQTSMIFIFIYIYIYKYIWLKRIARESKI